MSRLIITGKRELHGEIPVQGAKNGVLPLMASSLLSHGVTVIDNCPDLTDVRAALDILRHLGCRAALEKGAVTVDASDVTCCEIPDALMRRMRSSVMFLGPLLARCGRAVITAPGGCELGPRPIDLHLAAMAALGADVREEDGSLVLTAGRLTGAPIRLALPSVGATENAMLAAAGAEGVTVITGAAREPEIRDLGALLTKMGVRVHGAGTSTVTVEGGVKAPFARHRALPDRIAAATYLCCAAAAGGELTLTNTDPDDLRPVLAALDRMGAALKTTGDTVTAAVHGPLRSPGTVVTGPHPGFPTDAQPLLMAAALRAEGTTAFVENIFENRFRHVPALRAMGADIAVEGRGALVRGGVPLHGARVEATDLRGGAALVAAALAAEGVTDLGGLAHIDRGYENLAGLLHSVGAGIERIDGKEPERWKTTEGRKTPAAREPAST